MTKPTTEIALVNRTSSSAAHAYITGLDLNQNNRPLLIQADGKTVYHPSSPAKPQAELEADCAIPLGAPGSTTKVTIPQIAGGRIWFVLDGKLKFLVNPGPAIVEPSVTNPSDPNYHNFWGFCEFTYNQQQLFVNISYVDFVSLPIGLELLNEAGKTQSVGGLNPGGLDAICQELVDQNNKDRVGWDKLVVKGSDGKNLRALSPNAGRVLNPGLFDNYYKPYVDAVWAKYTDQDLTVNTQAQWGDVKARVKDGKLSFAGAGSFGPPSAADVFSCSTGPFATGGDVQMGAIGARLAAAFNRSTLLINANQPEGEDVATYYRDPVTNHYARVVHAHNAGGRGYAFPYDDVGHARETGAGDQAGTVFDGAPQLLTVTVGTSSSSSSGAAAAAAADGQKQRAVEVENPGEKQPAPPPQEGEKEKKKKNSKVGGVVDKVKNVVKKLVCK